MKLVVTSLKAPWPKGTKIGDTFEVSDEAPMPGWAVGKCAVQPDEAASSSGAAADPADLKIAQNMLAEAQRGIEQLTGELAKERQEKGDALNEAAVLKAERDRFAAELATANARVAELEAAPAAAKAKK
jgi:cob(I)alamin adenosyltransferase